MKIFPEMEDKTNDIPWITYYLYDELKQTDYYNYYNYYYYYKYYYYAILLRFIENF